MEPYERVMRAVQHRPSDRVPLDYVATPEFNAKLKKHLKLDDDEELRRRLGVDIRGVSGRWVGPEGIISTGGISAAGKDFLGVEWKAVENEFGVYNELAVSPLGSATTVREIDEYDWPNPDWYDFAHLKDQIADINREERYAILFFAGGAFESPWYMRGLTRFLMDLVECPDIAEAISRHCADFYHERAMRAIEASDGGIDIVGSGGDIGTQRGMMLAPELWRKHIKPYSRKLIRTFKDMGLVTLYHSCGSIVPVIDDFIEMGLDILDPIQPKAEGMAAAALKAEFGDGLAFHGGMDEQDLLPYGSPDQVRQEVKRLVDLFSGEGGYILCAAHALQPDTPVENVLVMYDEAQGRPRSPREQSR